jgi:predicted GIY-YIG superfamily endonuclease
MKTDYKNTFIYGLIENGTEEIKYIGKSNNPKRRVQQHVCDSVNRKTPKDYWIQLVIKKVG